jgi:hypothetical protein
MASVFDSVGVPHVGYNAHDMSHGVAHTFNMGELIPITVFEAIPGDRVKIRCHNLLRFSSLASPMMHRVNVTTHYFFVPNRILWPEWKEWIFGNSQVAPPVFNQLASNSVGDVGDYMGLPVDSTNNTETINALPFAAYFKIWDEWYRDQNLQDEITPTLVPGQNDDMRDIVYAPPLKRAWRRDYFTSCLPSPQKGAAVTLPLTVDQEVTVETTDTFPTNPTRIRASATGSDVGAVDLEVGADSLLQTTTGVDVIVDTNSSQVVNVNGVATPITDIRVAFATQQWLELAMRAGTRIEEGLEAFFGVKTRDARVNKPELIGGGRGVMQISEVLSTAQTLDASDNEIPIGDLKGRGISASTGDTYDYFCPEHGWIIGIVSVTPETSYSQGIPRKFQRASYLDYFWSQFAHVGEQAVLNKEIFAQGNTTTMNSTFGYQIRYAEYMQEMNRIGGEFRTTQNFWTLSRLFAGVQNLDAAFIECDPSRRIFNTEDPTLHTVYGDFYKDFVALRKVPRYGDPRLV